MDATKSSASTSVLSRSTLLSTVSSPVCGWQYHLAYEREKLNELRRQVAAQEERFTALQQQFEKFSSNSDTPEVNAQSSVIESLVKVKERELALALMRVAELTRQLDQLRQGQLDGVLVDSTSSHAKLLDRNPQLLQGIVRPLKSAHHSSAIERSRSAADIVLQAKSSNSSADQVIADASQFSSLPSEIIGTVRTTVAADHSSSSPGTTAAEKRAGLLDRKLECDTSAHIANAANTRKTFDMNENVIVSISASDAVPSRYKSARNSDTVSLISEIPSSVCATTTASTVNQISSSADSSLEGSSVSQADKPGSGDSTVDAASSRGSTRSWVSSSSYQQKLGLRGAGRYQSITNRLYGDNWLGSIGSRASERSTSNKTERGAKETVPELASLSKESQPNESLIPKTDNTALSTVSAADANSVPADANSKPSQSSSLHFVYSCSTSERTMVIRPSLTSESGDDDDDEDKNENNSIEEEVVEEAKEDQDNEDEKEDEEEEEEEEENDGDGRVSDPVSSAPQPKLSESKSKKAMVRWRQRLVASPPPRRAAHTPRRFEDPNKELGTTTPDAAQSRSYTAKLRISDTVPSQPLTSLESLKHVSFDPFTLSLNAALEGELDVLQSLFSQVDDKNQSNEDGLTVLHNAVCSGCLDVLEFLVHSGCDVNVADCDGWTPLHCAASSNNIEAIQLLIEHGAGVLAFTWDTEHETPLDKCCVDSPRYEQCYQFIAEAVKMLGVANSGRVYATANYEASSVDEMSFSAGDQLTVLHRGDEKETAWWWSVHPSGTEGYVPQNLLALYPPTGCKNLPTKSLIETSC